MNIKLNIDGKEYEVVSKEQKQQKELPKTWDAAPLIVVDELLCEIWKLAPSRYLALRKLEILRDIYNDGWKADFKDNTVKYGITFYKESMIEQNLYHTRCLLHFKTAELRDEFIKNFGYLIEEAKDLL